MPRTAALNVLKNVLLEGGSLNHALMPYAQHEQSGLIGQLCYGVCRYYFALEAILSQLMDKPCKAKDKDVEIIMLMGIYQLRDLSIKEFVAVDETVKLAKKIKKNWAKGLINAVLRSYLREKAQISANLASDPVYQYAHPKWLIDKISLAYEISDEILQNNNQQAPVHLRLNLNACSCEHYLELLSKAGIAAMASPYLNNAITLKQKVDVTSLPGFKKGWIVIQDIAAQFASQLLDLKPQQRVLDACSAPGGKLTAILQTGIKFDEVIAIDNDQRRIGLIQQNLDRLGETAKLICADLTDINTWWDGKPFDRILLDAPCSALGVIRRHPDIKLRRDNHALKVITQLQHQLLQAIWPCLRIGGKLLYATCSILPDENQNQLYDFITKNKNANLIEFFLPVGKAVKPGWQLLPGETDGFYYCLLEKIA